MRVSLPSTPERGIGLHGTVSCFSDSVAIFSSIHPPYPNKCNALFCSALAVTRMAITSARSMQVCAEVAFWNIRVDRTNLYRIRNG